MKTGILSHPLLLLFLCRWPRPCSRRPTEIVKETRSTLAGGSRQAQKPSNPSESTGPHRLSARGVEGIFVVELKASPEDARWKISVEGQNNCPRFTDGKSFRAWMINPFAGKQMTIQPLSAEDLKNISD